MDKNDLKGQTPNEMPQQDIAAILQQIQAAANGGAMNNISSNADYRQPDMGESAQNAQGTDIQKSMTPELIRQMVANDIQVIQNWVKSGAVDSKQGQSLMNYVLNKAFETTKQCTQGCAAQTPEISQYQQNNLIAGLDNPEFFQQDGRNQVLEYLKNANATVGKDEMSQIISMIAGVENAAVKRHLGKQEHEKTLNDENEAAKLRLRANAQKTGAGNNNGMVFTRDQIGKMSGAEFAKNEKSIMEQLRKGLIH